MTHSVRLLTFLTCAFCWAVFVVAQEKSVRPGINEADVRAGMRADQELFHFLLDHHAEIRRSVKTLESGVETLTESDNPEVTAKLQKHVASMHRRIKDGRGLRFWDELFVAIFQKHASIKMSVENTQQGVRVLETSEDRVAVALIQAHAEVVSLFVKHGFAEAQKNHPVPTAAPAAQKLESPIIP